MNKCKMRYDSINKRVFIKYWWRACSGISKVRWQRRIGDYKSDYKWKKDF